MKTLKTYGVMRPDGLQIGLREDLDGKERLACLYVESPSIQQGIVGAWLTVEHAKRLIGWLEAFMKGGDKKK